MISAIAVERDRKSGRASDLKSSLQDVFAQKASATVSGRAGPLARYIKHCISRQEQPFPVVEAGVYAFSQDYAAREAPTFARSFLSSLAFAKYTVSLKVPDEIFSPRVRGLSSKLYLDKRKTQQKPPLKVDHVRKLEAIATGSIVMEPPDRVAAGFFLWALFARARFSDAQAAGALQCDLSETSDGTVGYLESTRGCHREEQDFVFARKESQIFAHVCADPGLGVCPGLSSASSMGHLEAVAGLSCQALCQEGGGKRHP